MRKEFDAMFHGDMIITSTNPILQGIAIALLFLYVFGIIGAFISIYLDLKVVRIQQMQEKPESWYKRPQTTMSISMIPIFISFIIGLLLPNTYLYAVLRAILILPGLVFLVYSFRLIYNARSKRN